MNAKFYDRVNTVGMIRIIFIAIMYETTCKCRCVSMLILVLMV